MTDGSMFPCHPHGYIRHWLVAGPHNIPYTGQPGDENTLRRESLDHSLAAPPASASLHAAGPFGGPWRFYYPGGNFFVEHTTFYHGLVVTDSWAFTEIEATQDSQREARFWVAGGADLWVNGTHITRLDVTRYMYPDFKMVTLPLRRGINRICVRLQCFGVRDTCILFGLQLLDGSGLAAHIPGGSHLAAAADWLDGVKAGGNDSVVSSMPVPGGVEASVMLPGAPPIPWAAGESFLSLGDARPFRLSVQAIADGQTFSRSLEIPANRPASRVDAGGDLRRERLAFIGGMSGAGVAKPSPGKLYLPLLARRLSGVKSETDAASLDAVLAFINGRGDCADFALATLLRLEGLELTSGSESEKIRRTALAFRYWSDEPGNDAMCFWSENHSLLFHGCQLIAGRLYPGAVFANSGRTGTAQAEIGTARCLEWLDRIEAQGLEEFNSGTYLPITVAALLNVVDFSGDQEMSRRGSLLLDRIYEGLALHAFDGVVISPQGRVYRNVLYPGESGAQALLSDASPKAPPDFPSFRDQAPPDGWTGDWMVYPASSRNYRVPARLEALMEEPVSRRYRQANVEIVLHKTPACLLTSLSIPAPAGEKIEHGFLPGMGGYQQHLWQATLGEGCHVFVNHPGSSFDDSRNRPGYWYGNGVMPRLRQREGVIQAIYNIPDGSQPYLERTADEWASPPFRGSPHPYDLHPVPFTHVHWPSDAFDRQETRGRWLFGLKNDGCIALWCSEVLQPHDEVLTGREFRAVAWRSAWVVICGSITEHGSFESFIESCQLRQPRFDPASLSMRMNGGEPLSWD